MHKPTLSSSRRYRPHVVQTFGLITPYVRHTKRRFGALAILSVLAGGAEAVSLLLLVEAAVGLIDGEHSGLSVGPLSLDGVGLAGLLLAAFAATVASLLLRVPGLWLAATLQAESAMQARVDTYEAYLQSSWDARSTDSAGELQYLVTTHADRVGSVVAGLSGVVVSLFTLTAFVLGALVVAPLFALAVVVVVGASVGLLRPLRTLVARTSVLTVGANRVVAGLVAETAAMAKDLYVYGGAPEQLRRMRSAQEKHSAALRKVSFLRGAGPEIYRTIFFGIILVGLAITHAIESVDYGAVGGVVLMLLRSSTYVRALQVMSLSLAESEPYLDELRSEISRFRAARPPQGSIPGAFQTFELLEAGYSYDSGRTWALRNLNLTISAGEAVAIVGPSASGKSTLVDLLVGLRKVTEGEAKLNGLSADEVDRRWWTEHVSLVDQTPKLAADSISENIRFFRPAVSDDDSVRAARQAQIDREILLLPGGFSTVLGAGGTGLSGGQKQRVTIARALAGHPALIVLDEPTSALDSHSERRIVNALASLRQQVAIVVVTHRSSIIRLCDRVIVMESGAVVDDASPDVVRSRNQYFAQMCTKEVNLEDQPIADP